MDPQPATAPARHASRETAPGDAATRAETERNIAVLAQLREAALDFTMAIKRQAFEAGAPVVVEGDTTLAFTRACRTVRLTVALQQRLIDERQRADSGAGPIQTNLKVTFVDGPTGELRHNPADARPFTLPSADEKAGFQASKAQALGVVRGIAAKTLLRGELSPRQEAESIDRIEREAAERIEREAEDDFARLMRRPFSEIVAFICREIGLRPDWGVLAEEAWAIQELASGPVGAPLAPFGSRPDPGADLRPPDPSPPPGPPEVLDRTGWG